MAAERDVLAEALRELWPNDPWGLTAETITVVLAARGYTLSRSDLLAAPHAFCNWTELAMNYKRTLERVAAILAQSDGDYHAIEARSIARAALQPEGSAGTGCDETMAAASDHYERWETFDHVCTGRHYEPGHQCVCGAMWAAEGSARDGG